MKNLSSFSILEKSDLASNSTRIYFLKNKIKTLTDDFVEGFNLWEKSKADIIISMADTLERLHEMGEYPDDLNTISSHISQILRDRGVSEGQIDHVRRVLPSKYKNENKVRESAAGICTQNNTAVVEPVNIYELERNLDQLSQTELQDYGLSLEQKHKHQRANMKAEKEALEFIAIKNKYPLYRYKKESADPPPDHLHRETTLHEEAKYYSQVLF